MLEDVVNLMEVAADNKAVKLHLDAAYTPTVMIDPDRVAEALSNVVSNAIDACQPGDTVTVRSRRGDPSSLTLELEVIDTGSGIAPEHLPRVLEPFFTTKPIGEGSGLGLAIARRVMDEHDGDIVLESRPDEGTRVCMKIPIDLRSGTGSGRSDRRGKSHAGSGGRR